MFILRITHQAQTLCDLTEIEIIAMLGPESGADGFIAMMANAIATKMPIHCWIADFVEKGRQTIRFPISRIENAGDALATLYKKIHFHGLPRNGREPFGGQRLGGFALPRLSSRRRLAASENSAPMPRIKVFTRCSSAVR